MNRGLFGTSGIRGDAEKLFTKSFCFDIARTFIAFLKVHNEFGPIAIGMDPRSSSPVIKQNLIRGLSIPGIEVYDEGVTPIPSMNWLLKSTSIVAGIEITGSHIAPELNGVKFYAHQEEISESDQTEIESIYEKVKGRETLPESYEKAHPETRAKDLYADMLFGLAKVPYPGWKIALDCANGAQTVVMPFLLEGLSLDVVRVNCNLEENFIARDTDTDDKAGIEKLKETVKSENCSFGIAFDGDGDRVVFVDENGKFIQGEYSCSLVAKDAPGNVIVTTVSASQVIETIGKKIVRTKVGSPYVIEKMKEVGAKFGFEQNGGAISSEIMYTRDGGSTMIKLLNLFSKFKGKFSDFIGQLPKFYMFRTKVDYKWEQQDKIIDVVKKKFAGKKAEELDGLKIWLNDNTWILFRSSANAPEFRVFAESKIEETAKKLLDDGLNLVKEVITT